MFIIVCECLYLKQKYKMAEKRNLLLSTDTLWGCGLDLIFDAAVEAWFDGIDLAIWKNFDAWNVSYVKKLVRKHDMPVKVIQTSPNLNKKEIDKALDLCEALNIDTININAPKFFDYKAYSFIKDNLDSYKKANPDITFSIINPKDSRFFAMPIPKYRFSNIVEIIKKYGCNLWLEVSNIDEDVFEDELLRKISSFAPYISTIYLSDKNKAWKSRIMPGDWILKLPTFLKKVKMNKYSRYFSIRFDIWKADLVDADKVQLLLKKTVDYFDEHYTDVDVND